jgi:hypothetical protein
MIIQRIDILSPAVLELADTICFTANGVVGKNGALVMGAGVARQFRDKFPGIDKRAGYYISRYGYRCHIVSFEKPNVVCFPTKYHWRDPSNIDLIIRSSVELANLATDNHWNKVYLPFPGIGLGGLNKYQVEKTIAPLLDDRFIITVL